MLVKWRGPAVKTLPACLLIAACAVVAQVARPVALSPKRITATEIRQDGDATLYRGNVVVKLDSLNLYSSEMEYRANQWGFVTHGESRLALQTGATDYTRLNITDPARFHADNISQTGGLMTLHGSVGLNLPGWEVTAEDAVFDRPAATVTLRGDARFEALKPPIEGVPDTLGPVFLKEGQPAGN
jgi:hypothetical protein